MAAKRADLDGDGRAEIPVSSPWGLGILEVAGGSLSAPSMQPNGTRFGGWLLNTADNRFDLLGDFDNDGRMEILVSSPWGLAFWNRRAHRSAVRCWPRTGLALAAGC